MNNRKSIIKKALLLLLMCTSLQLHPFADGSTGDSGRINMLYGIVGINDLMANVNMYDLIISYKLCQEKP